MCISKPAYTQRIWHRHCKLVVAIGEEAGLCKLAIPSMFMAHLLTVVSPVELPSTYLKLVGIDLAI